MGYYVIIRRSSSRSFLGGYKAKKGVTKRMLLASIRAQRKKGYSYSIVTASQFAQLRKSKSKPRSKRKAVRHKPKRKKTIRRKR